MDLSSTYLTLYRNSYHDPSLMAAPGPWKTRGFERYDPYSRKYTNWGPVARPWKDDNPYPRFTADEMRKMRPRILKGKDPKPSQMGSEWTHLGPKVTDPLQNIIKVFLKCGNDANVLLTYRDSDQNTITSGNTLIASVRTIWTVYHGMRLSTLGCKWDNDDETSWAAMQSSTGHKRVLP